MAENIQPYRYEPVGRPQAATPEDDLAESDVFAENERGGRVGNRNWCSCHQCGVMAREVDCFCCRESPEAAAMHGQCIVSHADFQAVCLNAAVLRVAMVAHQEYRGPNTDPYSNR